MVDANPPQTGTGTKPSHAFVGTAGLAAVPELVKAVVFKLTNVPAPAV